MLLEWIIIVNICGVQSGVVRNRWPRSTTTTPLSTSQPIANYSQHVDLQSDDWQQSSELDKQPIFVTTKLATKLAFKYLLLQRCALFGYCLWFGGPRFRPGFRPLGPPPIIDQGFGPQEPFVPSFVDEDSVDLPPNGYYNNKRRRKPAIPG